MHLLIVEDDESIRDVMCDAMKVIHHEVETAANGAEALVIVRHRRPDAVFLDLMMPIMGGVEFAETCEHDPAISGVPFALVSAAPDLPAIARRLHASISIRKPFELEELWAAAAELGRETADRPR